MKQRLILWLMSVGLLLCSLTTVINIERLRALQQQIVEAERACQPTKSVSLR